MLVPLSHVKLTKFVPYRVYRAEIMIAQQHRRMIAAGIACIHETKMHTSYRIV